MLLTGGAILSPCLSSITVCSRMCQNGGSLDEGNCTCACAGGFSGPNCQSEFILWCEDPEVLDVLYT